jgi:hypothetical protein
VPPYRRENSWGAYPLLVWAVDVVVRGVKPSRRMLGADVLVFVVAGLVVR